jgi:hypothetical protein
MADKGPAIWDGIEPDDPEISYLMEMVTSPTSVYGFLGAVTAAAVLSIPLGFGFAALPLLAFGAAEGIAGLFIPSSPIFRERTNRKKRKERRENARQHLMEQISKRAQPKDARWKSYRQMCERLKSVRKIAKNRANALSARDVEALDDATVDFLSLWLAMLVMHDRRQSLNEGTLDARLRDIEQQLSDTVPPIERQRLKHAKVDLERLLTGRRALRARITAVETSLLTRPDTFEEIYQGLVANPNASDVSTKLQEAVARMRVEEELDLAVEGELAGLFQPSEKVKRRARQAQAKVRKEKA